MSSNNPHDRESDGGPAFPLYYPGNQEVIPPSTYGMSLRDWFAGQAMMGFIASNPGAKDGVGGAAVTAMIARASYAVADAMLKDRGK